MFANTLTLTIDGQAKTLLRNNQDNFGSHYEFEDSNELITMKIRHSSEINAGSRVKRHNVFVERKVYATPTTSEKYDSATITLRNREGRGPEELLQMWEGVATLFATLDNTFVAGDN